MKMTVMLLCALFGPTISLAACSGGGAVVGAIGGAAVLAKNGAPTTPSGPLQALVEGPGPNAAYASTQTFYSCSNNYYVSTNGNDNNTGKSSASPWLTFAHAGAQNLGSGSCVNVSPGIYEQTRPAIINNGGSAATQTGYVVWRCTVLPLHFSGGALQGEGSGCVIRAGTHFTGLPILVGDNKSYVIFDGLEFDGNNNSVNSCLYLNPQPHHIVILDSDFHGCGFGVGARNDWEWVIHSVWHDTGYGSNSGSGFSDWEPTALDHYSPTSADNRWCSVVPVSACYHVVIAYNVGYHNYDAQGSSGNRNTDGDGILLDTWSKNNYTASALVMGNIIYNNGGFGIGCYNGAQGGMEVFANNTTYGDGWDPHANFSRNELFSQGCYNAIFINNIAYGVAGNADPITRNTSIAAWKSGNATFANNISYGTPMLIAPGFSFPQAGQNRNLVADPKFASATYRSDANNFALQPDSPAIGFGQPFTLWSQLGPVDAGACPRVLTSCP